MSTLEDLAGEYGEWTFSWDYGQYWAVHDNYDASYEGPEDGWVDNGLRLSSPTIDGLRAELEEYYLENEQ